MHSLMLILRSPSRRLPPEGAARYRVRIYALDLQSIDDAGTPMTWCNSVSSLNANVSGRPRQWGFDTANSRRWTSAAAQLEQTKQGGLNV
jgi:hypothetical protein